jgi:alpha,alpha-trehalose phosphorylase
VRGREIVAPPEHIYPVDEWRIVESRYTDHYYARAETGLALSNGYIGIRGTYDEGRPALSPGTFINGFHETWPIVYGEEAYGLARTGQTIVDVPDATVLQLLVDDEPLLMPVARMREYQRVLDMRNGVLTRDLVWSTPAGKHVRVSSCRLVSLEHRHLAAISFEVTLLDHPAPVLISSQLINPHDQRVGGPPSRPDDPRLARVLGHRVLNCRLRQADGVRLLVGFETTHSGMRLGVGVDHVVDTTAPFDSTTTLDDDRGEVVFSVDAQPGVPFRLTKYVSYQISHKAPASELVARCARTLSRATRDGFAALQRAQRQHLEHFWDRADVQVELAAMSGRTQQAIRWNLFQVGQASWRAEGSGIPAKGLTGQAYDGHYFWDTEVFILPFLSYTQPRIARNLLRFRYSMLEAARVRARALNQRGALFPWRTITGEEASANFLAGTAQYHINADIADALMRYMTVRGDLAFAGELAGEILVETARFWEDLGFYGDDGRFHIHGVTGPDEYTTVVNDNTYTNLMARRNLRAAIAVVRRLERERPADYAALVADVALQPGELDAWERAADSMYVPYDQQRGIHPQDDTFLDREVWDLESTPTDKFPLLLHFHPLVIYRFQVLKQADIVLAMLLLGDEFSEDQKRRNFDYYDPLTTGDSSLSACVQSILAAEVGREEQAVAYFRYALLMDLADVAGNASDGVHIASAAGVWLALVYGFGGVRDFGGRLTFNPHLPKAWQKLEFSLRFRSRQLRISLSHDEERYLVDEGAALEVTIRGAAYRLERGEELLLKPDAG